LLASWSVFCTGLSYVDVAYTQGRRYISPFGFTRHSRDQAFVVVRHNRSFILAMAVGSAVGSVIGGRLVRVVPVDVLLPLLAAILLRPPSRSGDIASVGATVAGREGQYVKAGTGGSLRHEHRGRVRIEENSWPFVWDNRAE
jgi:hypothetical protein